MTSKSLFPEPKPGRKNVRRRSQISFKDHPSLTRQSPKAGTEIDVILRRYATQGVSELEIARSGQALASMSYGVQPSLDYQEALNTVIRVEEAFARLPSKIRDRFGHRAENMIAFIADPKNLEEAQKLGLVRKDPEKDPKNGTGKPSEAAPAAEKKPEPTK